MSEWSTHSSSHRVKSIMWCVWDRERLATGCYSIPLFPTFPALQKLALWLFPLFAWLWTLLKPRNVQPWPSITLSDILPFLDVIMTFITISSHDFHSSFILMKWLQTWPEFDQKGDSNNINFNSLKSLSLIHGYPTAQVWSVQYSESHQGDSRVVISKMKRAN